MKKLIGTFLRIGLTQGSNKFTFIQMKQVSKFAFTSMKGDSDPNQIPDEVKKMMQSQKAKKKPQELPILKDISQVKSMDQLPQIFQKMVFMSKEHREIAVRYLLSGIYQQNIPTQAITYRALDVVLKQFPQLKLETEIFQINLLIKKVNKLREEMASMGNSNQNEAKISQNNQKLSSIFNQINNLYYNSFNITLKTIPAQHITRSKATLYKHFAQYNFDYLFDPKVTQKGSHPFQLNESILKKAREFLIESLNCHKQIVLNEHKRIDSDQINKLKQEDSERHDIRLSAIKQNIRKIVESIGECLYAYFKIINKEHRMLRDVEEHKRRKIQLLSLIDAYIPLYSVIPGIKELSMLYYKLYKIKIQARFTSVGDPKTPQQVRKKVKQTVQDYNRLYKQCQDCLDESISLENFNSIKDISTTIISIKYMIGRTVKKDENQIKNSLALEAKNIIDKMKKQFKQPLQFYLMQIIKEMLNLKA